MKAARKLSRRLVGASLRAMILPRRRGSLIGRIWLIAAVLGPVLYLDNRGRASLRLLAMAGREDEPAQGLEWQ